MMVSKRLLLLVIGCLVCIATIHSVSGAQCNGPKYECAPGEICCVPKGKVTPFDVGFCRKDACAGLNGYTKAKPQRVRKKRKARASPERQSDRSRKKPKATDRNTSKKRIGALRSNSGGPSRKKAKGSKKQKKRKASRPAGGPAFKRNRVRASIRRPVVPDECEARVGFEIELHTANQAERDGRRESPLITTSEDMSKGEVFAKTENYYGTLPLLEVTPDRIGLYQEPHDRKKAAMELVSGPVALKNMDELTKLGRTMMRFLRKTGMPKRSGAHPDGMPLTEYLDEYNAGRRDPPPPSPELQLAATARADDVKVGRDAEGHTFTILQASYGISAYAIGREPRALEGADSDFASMFGSNTKRAFRDHRRKARALVSEFITDTSVDAKLLQDTQTLANSAFTIMYWYLRKYMKSGEDESGKSKNAMDQLIRASPADIIYNVMTPAQRIVFFTSFFGRKRSEARDRVFEDFRVPPGDDKRTRIGGWMNTLLTCNPRPVTSDMVVSAVPVQIPTVDGRPHLVVVENRYGSVGIGKQFNAAFKPARDDTGDVNTREFNKAVTHVLHIQQLRAPDRPDELTIADHEAHTVTCPVEPQA